MRRILWRYFKRGAGAGSACDVLFEGGVPSPFGGRGPEIFDLMGQSKRRLFLFFGWPWL